MEKKNLKVFQIYFDESQKDGLEPNYLPHFNPDCTPFFESQVIRELVEKGEHFFCDYFGVVSYQLKNKLGYEMKFRWRDMPNIANHSTSEFTAELFQRELDRTIPDVMSFQRHIAHDPISYADQFHPNFSNFFKEVMRKIGYTWEPTKFENVFYCNFFVAKAPIYHDFVKDMLAPAMDVMKTMPELHGNSLYPKPLPQNLADKFGYNHYSYHSFLCERMFSYFAHLNKLECLHY